MARKFLSQKRHVGGLESPRNSMELSHKSSKNSYSIRDNVPLSYNVTGDWSQDEYYPFDGLMKTLITEEEISIQPNTRHNTPSIVARLMGMETLPSDTNLLFEPVVKKNGNLEFSIPKKERSVQGTFGHVSISSRSTRQLKSNSLHHDYWRSDVDDSYHWLEKPKRREHPQEEELQKFKKEFEAWQAAQVRECPQVAEIGNAPEYLNSQADFDDEVVSFYANSGRERNVELETSYQKPQSHLGNGCHIENNHMKLSGAKFNGTHIPMSNNWNSIHGYKEVPLINYDCNLDNSLAPPTRIVILRPGPDLAANGVESRATSSSTMEDRSSIVDFLEEVKERLKNELHGRPLKRTTVVRGGGIETPFSEKNSETMNTTGNQTTYNYRENIPGNHETTLQRSESTRSYISEIHFHGPSSPEFISRDTRRFLTDRLKYVSKKDTRLDASVNARISAPSEFHSEGNINGYQERPNIWGNANDLAEMRNRNQSVRYGFDNDFLINKEPSPGSLIRSLSAPVSGTSFAKLLLEDRLVTNVQIRRKHEQVNNVPVSVHRQRKERFNFREKVSTFRHSFTLRKKLQTLKETNTMGNEFLNDIISSPSVMMNFDDRLENSTEVPPSPASVCSSINEELWRPSSYATPLSTPDLQSIDGDSVISSNQNDLLRELKNIASNERDDDHSVSEDLFTEHISEIKHPNEIDHKALVDLLDEKLPNILTPPSSTMSKLGLEVTYPHGHKSCYSLDNMVVPWARSSVDLEVNFVGREMECLIIGDLVDELVKDFAFALEILF